MEKALAKNEAVKGKIDVFKVVYLQVIFLLKVTPLSKPRRINGCRAEFLLYV